MKVKEYFVSIDQYLKELEKSVNKMILNGWQPIGGIHTTNIKDGKPFYYYQSMIKYEDPNTEGIWDCPCGVDAVGEFCSQCGLSYEWFRSQGGE